LIKLHIRRGKCYYKLGNFSAASESLRRLLESPKPSVLISRQDSLIKDDIDDNFESWKIEAKQLLKHTITTSDMFEKVIKLYQKKTKLRELELIELTSMSKELLNSCPQSMVLVLIHADMFCYTKKWSEAKTFVESKIRQFVTDPCFKLMTFADVEKRRQFPRSSDLVINDTIVKPSSNEGTSSRSMKSTYNLHYNINAIMEAIVCMGSELAQVYMTTLKNNESYRTCCGSLMDHVFQTVRLLRDNIDENGKLLLQCDKTIVKNMITNPIESQSCHDWSWIDIEYQKLKLLIELKNHADESFRAGDYAAALQGYGNAMKVNLIRVLMAFYFDVS
jgi:hypothetical protein